MRVDQSRQHVRIREIDQLSAGAIRRDSSVVERILGKAEVQGSNPCRGTTLRDAPQRKLRGVFFSALRLWRRGRRGVADAPLAVHAAADLRAGGQDADRP